MHGAHQYCRRGRQAHPQPSLATASAWGLPARCWATRPSSFLDEPTVGLDPKQIIEIRELIRSLGQEHTVLLSSHILSEVNAVCDKVLIMSHGKLVACDTPEKPDSSRGRARRTAHHGAGNAGGGAGRAVPAAGAGERRLSNLFPGEEEKRRHGPHRLLWRRGICAHRRALRWRARAWPCCGMDAETTSPEDVFPGVDRGRAGGR